MRRECFEREGEIERECRNSREQHDTRRVKSQGISSRVTYTLGASLQCFRSLQAHPPSERRRAVKHRSLAILRDSRHLLRSSTTSCRVTSSAIRKIQRLRTYCIKNQDIPVSVPQVRLALRLSIAVDDRHIKYCNALPSRRGCVFARSRVVRVQGGTGFGERGVKSVLDVARGRKSCVLQVEGRNQQAGRSVERGGGSRRGGGH